jgi:transcriptional regulator with GAF, ATPase, and Fis domain
VASLLNTHTKDHATKTHHTESHTLKKTPQTIVDRVKHGEPVDLPEELKAIEITAIRLALEKSNGIKAQAARMLGMEVTAFHMKLKRWNIAA